jgi:hypothetical protein
MPRPSQITEMLLFKQIWAHSDKKSFLTGLWLREFVNTPFFPSLFAHVLPKGQNKYVYFKYYSRNIILLTPGEHALYDQGTEEARIQYTLDVEEQSGGQATCDWAKLKALEIELLAEYKKVFPSSVGMIIGVKYSVEEQTEKIGKLNKAFPGDWGKAEDLTTDLV